MENDIDLGYAVSLPPEQAIHYFESKGRRITFDWKELWQEAHARAFTVAGVTKLDVLRDIQDATADAIAKGQNGRAYLNALSERLRKKGWWGVLDAADPHTGEVKRVRMTPARLSLIYRQNTQSAYMAGRYKQQMENAASAPYLRYVAVLDQKTRPTHAALHGRVFRYDDPVWNTHYPPNGWGCRCRVDSMSEHRLQRHGLAVQSSAGRMVTRQTEINNSRTGRTEQRIVTGFRADGGEICYTDVGFSYNGGKTWLEDIKAAMPNPPQGQAATTWQELGLSDLRQVPKVERLPAPALLPAQESAEAAESVLAATLGFTSKERLRIIETPLGRRTIWRDKLMHMVEKRADGRERFGKFVLETLLQPYEVWLKEHADGLLRENYIGLFQQEKYALLVVTRINRDGSLLWNIMHRDVKAMNKLREGWLIWRQKS